MTEEIPVGSRRYPRIIPRDRSEQRPDPKACSFPYTSERLTMRTTAPSLRVKGISAAETNESLTKQKAPPPESAAGLLLMDSSLNLISFNVTAVQILGYPDNSDNLTNADVLLTQKIRSSLISEQASAEIQVRTEFQSGRRRYFCRSFRIGSRAKDPSDPVLAVLLERGPFGLFAFSQVCEQFDLTKREREALEYLLQGLSTKEIADRMRISPSTVKAFLRLIMIKTGVSSRSAVVGKIIMTQPCGGSTFVSSPFLHRWSPG